MKCDREDEIMIYFFVDNDEEDFKRDVIVWRLGGEFVIKEVSSLVWLELFSG